MDSPLYTPPTPGGSDLRIFSPSEDVLAFRQSLGSFSTGVTVVTTITPEGPMGITANSFASVSLDPPLVLWSPAKSSHRHPHFIAAARFAIHVLNADQKHISDGFIRSKTAFDGIDWTPSHAGVPLIAGVLACFECNLKTVHDAGDHSIIIGQVMRVQSRDGAPLVFHGGLFGGFSQS